MKGFFSWFKSSTKIKRWIFLILVGIALVCYGIAKILVTDELEIKSLGVIIIAFAVGVTFVVLSIVHIQRRTLELLVQETDTRNVDTGKVDTLIFNKKVYDQGPKVVVIGGGAGLNTVLRGLKNYTDNITAIVTVSDYGNNNNEQITPLEDLKESFVALAKDEEKLRKLLNAEVENKKEKIRFSDMYFYAMQDVAGDFVSSIEDTKDLLNITGSVLPVTLDKVSICAELDDGTVVKNKDEIPSKVIKKISKINRVYLSPTNCKVAPGVLDAIREADAIVIGPGSLYTNVIPNLLVPGVSKTIRESKAFKIYVANIMTEFGQTDNFSLSDHINAIIEHAGKGIVDYCIYDTGEIIPEYIRKYNEQGCDLVEQDTSNVKALGIKLIQRNLSQIDNEIIRHKPDAIATAIIQLICDDLKFNDMKNDAQFMMLDYKVKDTKKKLKKEEKEKKELNKTGRGKREKGKASKFYDKYEERINSIKESEKGHSKSKSRVKTKTKSIDNAKKEERIVVEPDKERYQTTGRRAKHFSTKR